METWLIVVIVVAGLAIAGLIALLILLAILAAGGISAARFTLTPVRPEQLDEYLQSEASFAVSATRDFPNPPEQVFAALLDERFQSSIPFSKGVDYGGTRARSVGTKRAYVNIFGVIAEQIIVNEPGQRLGITITSCSIPLLLRSAAEDFTLAPAPAGGTRLTWQVGGTPMWVGWLPLRLLAPFVRPVTKWQLGRLRKIMPGR